MGNRTGEVSHTHSGLNEMHDADITLKELLINKETIHRRIQPC